MQQLSLTRLGIGVLVGFLTAGAGATSAPPGPRHVAAAQAGAHLIAFGSRGSTAGAASRKLDAALADLARHASLARPDSAWSDLRSLNPAARFMPGAAGAPMVAIDAITRGDPQRLKDALVSLGLEHPAVYSNDVGGWLPLSQLATAGALAELHAMRAAMPRMRTGAVTTQGDFAQGSALLRASWPTLDGSGVTVGVLSDSYDCYAAYAQPGSGVPASGPNGYASNGFLADAGTDVSSGDLPSGVRVLAEAPCPNFGAPLQLPFGDEGRAILQIVHDVAPGASLAFYTAVNSEADFASGIGKLATAGAKVIGDDVGYFDEPFFQPSLVAEAIDNVNAQGVAYFVAAGNDGQLSYDNTAPHFATPSTSPAGEMLLNFDTSGATTATSLPVTIAPALNGSFGGLVPGEFVAVVVEWDQPYVTGAPGSPGATSQIDLCVSAGPGGDIITDLDGNPVSCTGPNATGIDPVQIILIGNPANAAGGANTAPETVSISLGLLNGSPAPGRIKVAIEDNGAGSTINQFFTPGATVQGHAGAAGAMSVGAAFWAETPACGTTPVTVESFTSAGGDPILFDASGSRLAVPLFPQKPDFIAPDGGNDTFLGFVLSGSGVAGFPQCQNNTHFPSFFGTSAATPHAAAVAALMLQANAAVTPAQIYAALKNSATPMAGVAAQVGAGFIQADAALALLPPAAPTLTLAAASIAAGASTTLTWSSVNTTGCTASGSWSGTQTSSGSETVMPAAGSYTYTLTCSNAAGSAAASAHLAVQSPPSSGGGGAADGLALLALAALAGVRAAQRRTSPRALPSFRLQRAISAAHSGATALVPPITCATPSTSTW